jgi:hypothetical protein
MWKKLGSSASISADSCPDSISSESVIEMLMGAIRDSNVAK